MSKSFTTTVSLSNQDYVINNDGYFNAKSIAINPKAALITTLFTTAVGGLAYGLMITGLGATLNVIFDISLSATALTVTGIAGGVAGLNHYVFGEKFSLQNQDAKTVYDSFHFTYDVAKIKAFGNPEVNEEQIDILSENSITAQPISQIDISGELPNVFDN